MPHPAPIAIPQIPTGLFTGEHSSRSSTEICGEYLCGHKQPMKGALIVCPCYRYIGDEDEKKTQKLLTRLNLMPSELDGYGTQADITGLRVMLEKRDFRCTVASGAVDASVVSAAMRTMLEACDIFVFAFCGHGSAEDSSHHTALLLSNNVRLSSRWVNAHLTGFSGTAITILNLYHADSGPLPVSDGGLWSRSHSVDVAAALNHRTISVQANNVDSDACRHARGSPLIRAIVDIMSGGDSVTYESFGRQLASQKAIRGVQSHWVYQRSCTGDFFGPACSGSTRPENSSEFDHDLGYSTSL